MLVLSRKVGSGVFIDLDIQITLSKASNTRATLRIVAPRNRSIRRSKLDPRPPMSDPTIRTLVLTVKVGESLIVDETTELFILRKSGNIQFGIEAPSNVKILRTELCGKSSS